MGQGGTGATLAFLLPSACSHSNTPPLLTPTPVPGKTSYLFTALGFPLGFWGDDYLWSPLSEAPIAAGGNVSSA